MRVLIVNAHGADAMVGGAEQYVADLGRGFRARGWEMTLLAAFPPKVDAWAGRAAALHATDWRDNPVRRLRNHVGDLASFPTRKLEAAVVAAAPEVVHTHNLPGISTAVWEACRRAGVPVVHTIHDYYLLCPRVTMLRRTGEPCNPHPLLCGTRSARLARWAGAVADVIAVSDYVARLHAHIFAPVRTQVVRTPVAPLARPLTLPQAPPRTIGFLGALTGVKGVVRLLEAAPCLRELGFRVRIAGGGPLQAQIERAVAAGLVEYAGVVHGEQKLRFMESCDVAILPSLWNEPGGPPCSVAEWLGGGRPVLVSPRGGLREVAARQPGVLSVEPSAEGIVEAARSLSAPGRFDQVLAEMPTDVEARELDRWLDAHQEIYETALRRSRQGRDA